MKKTLIIIILIIIFVGLAYLSRPQSYEATALEYLKTQVMNPESVEPIKFGQLKIAPNPSTLEIVTLMNLERDTLELKRNITLQKAKNTTNKDSAKIYLKLSAFYNSQDSMLSISINKIPKVSPKLKLWELSLIYRAKDKNNTFKVDTCRFILNENLNEVNYVEGVNL